MNIQKEGAYNRLSVFLAGIKNLGEMTNVSEPVNAFIRSVPIQSWRLLLYTIEGRIPRDIDHLKNARDAYASLNETDKEVARFVLRQASDVAIKTFFARRSLTRIDSVVDTHMIKYMRSESEQKIVDEARRAATDQEKSHRDCGCLFDERGDTKRNTNCRSVRKCEDVCTNAITKLKMKCQGSRTKENLQMARPEICLKHGIPVLSNFYRNPTYKAKENTQDIILQRKCQYQGRSLCSGLARRRLP